MSPPRTTEEPSGQRQAAKAPRARSSDGENPGVLSSLPSTRPQRTSAHRAAARRSAARRAEGAKPTTTQTRPGPTLRTRPKPSANTRPGRGKQGWPEVFEPAVPPQGFEAEEAIVPGRSVHPPSGPELAVSVAELFGELAQVGLATGGRLLSDALKRLSGE